MNTVGVNGTETSIDRVIQLQLPQPVRRATTHSALHNDKCQRLHLAMSPKNSNSSQPLTPADGNKRKSGRVKPSSKEKENRAQQAEGFTVDKEGDISLPEMSVGPIDEQEEQGITDILQMKFSRVMDHLTGLSQQVAEVSQQNNDMVLSLAEAWKEIAEVYKENSELRKHIEDLEVQMH